MFSIPCKQEWLCVQLQLALSSEQLVSTELRPEGLLQGGRTVVETPHRFPGNWGVSLWNKQTGSCLLNSTPCVFPNPSLLPVCAVTTCSWPEGSELFHQVCILPDTWDTLSLYLLPQAGPFSLCLRARTCVPAPLSRAQLQLMPGAHLLCQRAAGISLSSLN